VAHDFDQSSQRAWIYYYYYDRFRDFVTEVSGYIRDGRVKYRETIAEGLDSAPEAFINLLKGGNFSKQLVSVAPDPTRR
jgi:NADPH-dependent curcumin reductase CurA